MIQTRKGFFHNPPEKGMVGKVEYYYVDGDYCWNGHGMDKVDSREPALFKVTPDDPFELVVPLELC